MTIAESDRRRFSKKPAFKEPDKDSLREDSLNRYIEAAKVRPLSEYLRDDKEEYQKSLLLLCRRLKVG